MLSRGLAPALARADDPASVARDQRFEIPSAAPNAWGCFIRRQRLSLAVFVPNLTPGFEISAGLLVLKPGADNLGYGTITTFLPIQSPQWAVQTLAPNYQPCIFVGTRYVLSNSGIDMRLNWDHLHTSDSTSVAVSDPTTQWVSPFSQTGPSTSEAANVVGIFHLKAASAQVNFDYDMVNADVGQTVNFGSHTQFRLFARPQLRSAEGATDLDVLQRPEHRPSTSGHRGSQSPAQVHLPEQHPRRTRAWDVYASVSLRLGLQPGSRGFGFVGPAQRGGPWPAGSKPAQYSSAGTLHRTRSTSRADQPAAPWFLRSSIPGTRKSGETTLTNLATVRF